MHKEKMDDVQYIEEFCSRLEKLAQIELESENELQRRFMIGCAA